MFYYDFKALVIMLMITSNQMIDIRTIATNAFAHYLNSFQMKDFPNIIIKIYIKKQLYITRF